MTDAPPVSAPSRRPGRRLRPVEVVGVERLGPRLVSATLTGELDAFHIDAPAQHVKVLIPGPDEHTVALPEMGPDGPVWPADQPRAAVRTYTPRRFDVSSGVLEIQFVLHGEGPASRWAERAVPGDRLAIAGPGGRLSVDLDDGPWIIAGDESAVPAIGTLLDALPSTATAQVFIETEDGLDSSHLGGDDRWRISWLRPGRGEEPGSRLQDALEEVTISADAKVWVACEAVAVRRIRRYLLETAGVPAKQLVTRGYWRAGEADHPDRDYGDA
jgi:NADPH-dependent ferric siderophore reductase